MELEIGDGFRIRSFRPEDAPSITKYANNRQVSCFLRDSFPHPYSMDDALAWLDRVSKERPETNFGLASSDEVIGGIGLALQTDIHRLSAELGYWLGEPYWGRGIATRAVRAFTDYAFKAYHLVRIYAYVFSNNHASTRVLKKAGYQFEGRLKKYVIKDGRILDMLLFAVVR